MDWYNIEDIIFESKEKEIKGIKCPDCGHTLLINKDEEGARATCEGCGIIKIYG